MLEGGPQQHLQLAVRDRFANVGDNATQEGPFWNSGLWAQKAA